MKRGKRYSQARKKLNLSQDELSQIIGITQTSISKMERDIFEKPNHEYTDYLVSQGFDRNWLVNGDDEIKTENITFSNKTKGIKEIEDSEIFDEKLLFEQKLKEKEETIKEQEKKIDRLNTLLMSANEKIDNLTSLLLSKFDFKDLEKLKAYTMQPLPKNSAVYAHS